MSSTRLREAALDRIAAGWGALGGQLEVAAYEQTALDIEALIVATAVVSVEDPRIEGVGLDWCAVHTSAVNVNRLRRVSRELRAEEATGRFAATLSAAGGPSWPFVGQPRPAQLRRKAIVRDLQGTARLQWRLRAVFGVSARSEILRALLLNPRPRTLAELARECRYTKRNVALAVDDLRLAGVLETSRLGNSDRVRLSAPSPLASWLVDQPAPETVDWVSRWAVVLELLRLHNDEAPLPEVVRLVEARAALKRLDADLVEGALPRPAVAAYGDAFAGPLADFIGEVAVLLADVTR